MIVNDFLRAWEEGVTAVASPVLRRQDEVSRADLGQHAGLLRIKTHLQTGQVTYGTLNASYGKGCTTTPTASWNKGCGGEPTMTTGICP
jgi:hypothetical protein